LILAAAEMPGSKGTARMKEVIAKFHAGPLADLAGMRVVQVRDYENQTVTPVGGKPQPLEGPKGDLVIFDLDADGNYVACRPSGTEPKIKFYLFTFTPPEQLSSLEAAKSQLEERLGRMEADLRKFAGV
jgi:phosphoglucomutase/phosphomannomutase